MKKKDCTDSSAMEDKIFQPLPDPSGVPQNMSEAMKVRDELAKKVFDEAVKNPTGKERIIGDLHFYGRSIIHSSPRRFTSVEQMNEFMIKEWNSVTADEDTVIVNGDFIDFEHCTVEQAYEIIDRLKGSIILILGNHDRPYEGLLRAYGARLQVIPYPILKDDFWIISHEPKFVSIASPYANVFAHVHLNPMYKDVSPRSFCTSAERIGYKPVLWSYVKEAVRYCCGEEDKNEAN